MNDRNVAKKYLVSVSAMLAVLFLLTMGILLLAERLGGDGVVSLSLAQMLLLSLASAYLPCASFTGFCVCFIPITRLTKALKLMLVLLFPIALACITLVGIVMLIPTIIKEIIVLKK